MHLLHYSKSSAMDQNIDFKKIPISCEKTIEFIFPKDFVRVEALQNFTKIYKSSGEIIISNSNIGFFKSSLMKYKFIICHRSHIINPAFLIRFHKDGHLELEDGTIVPLARRRKKFFMDLVIEEPDMFSERFVM